MLSQKVKGIDVYYYDGEDPVLYYLKKGHLFGESNFNILRRFCGSSSGTILDCGAHIGTFSVPAALSNYNVVALEGASRNVECLSKTFEYFPNVKVVEAILSDSERRCSFDNDYGPFGCLIEDENGPFLSQTVDTIVDSLDITDLVAIKLDIEGGEELALKGASKTLEKFRSPILMEINGHCLRLIGKRPADLLNEVANHNYSSFFILSNNLFKVDPIKLFPFCVTDVICIHNDSINFSFYELTDSQIGEIAIKNYQNSNDDCKRYFQSIGIV